MTRKQKIWLAIALAHLGLVTYNAFLLPSPSERNPAGLAFSWYGGMTGAGSSYGFFKSVGDTSRVSFILKDADGNEWRDVLDAGDNREAKLRFEGSPAFIDDFGDALAARWAGALLGRHPKAISVEVVMEEMDPPSMPEYREGARPTWRRAFTATFYRKK